MSSTQYIDLNIEKFTQFAVYYLPVAIYILLQRQSSTKEILLSHNVTGWCNLLCISSRVRENQNQESPFMI